MTVFCTFDKRYSPLSEKEATDLIETTDLPIYYRFGYGWKGAEKRETTKKSAKEYLFNSRDGFADLQKFDDYLLVNTYSANDLW